MDRQNINNGWMFYRNAPSVEELASSEGVAVNLPHTWNNIDGQDGGNDYYRGVCYYKKVVDIDKDDSKDYYIEFEGVNMVADVYVNDTLVTHHEGGFSRFRANVSAVLNRGENTIIVAVDNRSNGRVYPDFADFTFFGGIYRDVYFIEVNHSRFDLDYYGSDGVSITPILHSDNSADISFDFFLTNAISGQNIAIDIVFDGKTLASETTDILTEKYTIHLAHPMLWDGTDAPNLYTAHIRLMNGDSELDSRDISFGVRGYKVDKDGFYMNGRRYPLHGVSRHQDRLNKGWAITQREHDQDMALIREVGANTIRLAHYQHAQYFYDLCDRYGMVVWAEIPYISRHMNEGDDNAMSQMRELIIQNYNHPSIMFWGLSNEITMHGESDEQYALHERLESLAKELDPTRLTTMACVTMCDTESPLLSIPDIIAYNHYFGWYIGAVDDNGAWLDQWRERYPNKPIAISEYGAEGILTWHSSTPHQGDYTEEYQCYYHEKMLEIFRERPYLWATYVWNMFDFAADARDEGGVTGRNNKGLVTYDRLTKKDSFYLYKAYWSDEPFVHICSKRYKNRAEKHTKIKVYSNQPTIDLYVGDKLFESKSGAYVYEFLVPLSILGTNITATSGSLRDSVRLRRVLRPYGEYTMKQDSSIVHNWFEKDGVRYTYEYPEGMFSIRDKFKDIYGTDEGKALLDNMMAQFGGQDGNAEKFVKSARLLLDNMTIERIAGLAGDKISEDVLYALNVELNKITKSDVGKIE